jgi:hypothetical protein
MLIICDRGGHGYEVGRAFIVRRNDRDGGVLSSVELLKTNTTTILVWGMGGTPIAFFEAAIDLA